jgi:hypothetical protein
MSAYMHNDAHFAAIVASFPTLVGFPPAPMSGMRETANMLATQNRRSVDARYEPGAFGAEPIDVSEALISHYLANPLTVAEFVMALDSYAYQSCETRDWAQTKAFAFYTTALEFVGASTEGREGCAIRSTAAYDAAGTWSISGPDLPEPAPVVEDREPLVVETVVVEITGLADVLAGDDSDALVTAIITGDEDAGLTELANSHRGQMRRAAVALGLVTKTESRKLTRPIVANMLATHIVKRALGQAA